VIGGGITGMSAALDAANAGYEVTIVEKLPSWAARQQLAQATAGGDPYEALIPRWSMTKSRPSANPNITVKTETVVARLAGEPGDFTVTFKKPGEKIRVRRSLIPCPMK
jgi:quinone-modifying oxidoreductase subunit QmoB